VTEPVASTTRTVDRDRVQDHAADLCNGTTARLVVVAVAFVVAIVGGVMMLKGLTPWQPPAQLNG
jgi:hypothetical protein